MELDHVIRTRKMEEIGKRRDEIHPRLEELEAKRREIESELNVLKGENQSLMYRQQDLRGDVKGRVSAYASLLQGPNFKSYNRLLKTVGM